MSRQGLISGRQGYSSKYLARWKDRCEKLEAELVVRRQREADFMKYWRPLREKNAEKCFVPLERLEELHRAEALVKGLGGKCKDGDGTTHWACKCVLEKQVYCANLHADLERMVSWLKDPRRKPATIAFTEGPERQLGYAIEGLLAQEIERRKAAEAVISETLIANHWASEHGTEIFFGDHWHEILEAWRKLVPEAEAKEKS